MSEIIVQRRGLKLDLWGEDGRERVCDRETEREI